MITVNLNEAEREILYRQDTGTGGDGGWQSLLVGIQRALNEQTGEVTLTESQMERIQRYAFNYGNGGWEDRLSGIFGRTLGPRLNGDL
jgi:hypothetical protein